MSLRIQASGALYAFVSHFKAHVRGSGLDIDEVLNPGPCRRASLSPLLQNLSSGYFEAIWLSLEGGGSWFHPWPKQDSRNHWLEITSLGFAEKD